MLLLVGCAGSGFRIAWPDIFKASASPPSWAVEPSSPSFPDLSKFNYRASCWDNKSVPPEVTRETHQLHASADAQYNEVVRVTTVAKTGAQFFQYAKWGAGVKLLNATTPYGQLFAKIEGRLQEFGDTELYMRLFRTHVPDGSDPFLGYYMLSSSENFACTGSITKKSPGDKKD